MYLTVDNQKTHVATGGKEFDASLPTVLFVHGTALDHRCWALQTRWFAFNGYSVLAPDLPGHSLSDGEALSSIEAMGAWLGKLIDASGASAVHVVGHSQGFLDYWCRHFSSYPRQPGVAGFSQRQSIRGCRHAVDVGFRRERTVWHQCGTRHATDCYRPANHGE